MQSPYVYAQGDEGDDLSGLSLQDRPINLVDIGRVLGASAHVERREGAVIRAWRDDLTLIRDSLSYARTVLIADAAILSQAGSATTNERRDIVDELPGMLAGAAAEEPWREQGGIGGDIDVDIDFDEGLFVRTDHLLAAHRQMASVDVSSPASTARVRELIDDQLAMLTERQAAVEARLQQIRAVIIRRYRDAATFAQDQPA